MGELVLTATRDGVRTLTLNRPEKMNSLNAGLYDALVSELDRAEADGARAVLLTATGRAFCAGQDLDGLDPAQDLGALLDRTWNPLVRRIRALPLPVVCAVNGTAAGAGVSLALACDVVLAARSARFIQAFVRIGLLPDAGGTWFLPRLVGDARARALAMLGDPLPAERAEEWGMIWRCVDDAALMTEAEALAARLAALPTRAMALIKQAFLNGAQATLDQQLDAERGLQSAAGKTPDYAEGVKAFLEKRAPVFTGKPD